MTTPTKEDRARLRALAEAATPGPWRACQASGGKCQCGTVWSISRDHPVATAFRKDDEIGEIPAERMSANAAFIAASRQTVPALLDALDAAESKLAPMPCGHPRYAETREPRPDAVPYCTTCATLEALETAEARAERLEKALRAARECINGQSEDVSYGFFHGDDPREFHPDEEVCSAEELAAHKVACEAWNRGERLEIKKSGRIETISVPERVNKDGETVPAHTANAIVCGGSFGMGTHTVRDPFLDALLVEIDAAIADADREETR